MDTASHLLFGFTLAGLAQLDPVVAQQPELLVAVTCGTVIGSQAPDFDTVVRVRGYSSYLRFHRGVTHSIPALLLWPLLITSAVSQLIDVSGAFFTVFLWTFAAVLFHVFLDMLNSYGVQCFRPFTKKWIHLDILAIFEPFLFILHLVGLGLAMMGNFAPGTVFGYVYGCTFGYIALRALYHHYLIGRVKAFLQVEGVYQVSPSFHWFRWTFVVESADHFYTGKIVYRQIILEEIIKKEDDNQVIKATIGTDGVRAFLGFAQRVHVTCKELQDGYEVRWSDVRFWHNRKLPFGVDVRLDKNLQVVKHKLGWRKKAWDPPFV